jgi:hypothetical protein
LGWGLRPLPDTSCWSWEGSGETGGSFASIHSVHRGLFVDLGPIFQYSKVLARCCAWGLGVLTRTNSEGCPGKCLRGFSGAGHRLRDSGVQGPAQPGPLKMGLTPAASHPNRFVWQWVDFEARARLAWADAVCAFPHLRIEMWGTQRLVPVCGFPGPQVRGTGGTQSFRTQSFGGR